MKEHDEIDELFRNELEDFRPDAAHLHYAPIADAVASKAAFTAVKAGFWTKFGLPVLLGTTVATGTVVTIALNSREDVSLKTAIRHVKLATVELADETNTVVFEQKSYSGNTSADPVAVEQFRHTQTNTEVKSSDRKRTTVAGSGDKPVQSYERSVAPKTTKSIVNKPATPLVAKMGEAELILSENPVQTNPPKTVIARFIGTNIEGAEDLEGIPVYRRKGRKPVHGYMQKHVPVADYLLAMNVRDSLAAEELLVAEADSMASEAMRIIRRPEPVWPKREINIRAGLAYVPLQQETELYSSLPDSVDPFFWGAYEMVKRPSTKNEFLLSLGYQKQLPNKLEFGAGFLMSQGGWRAYDDMVTHYWIDNLDGTYTFYNDTSTVGEWDVSYRSYGISLSMGYHFPLGQKLAFGVNGGIAGSQILVENTYRYYETNSYTSTKNTRFALSLFALGEFTYRLGPLGISAGVNLNGRSEYSHVFNASGFYNNVSFGVHTGIHYYLPEIRR